MPSSAFVPLIGAFHLPFLSADCVAEMPCRGIRKLCLAQPVGFPFQEIVSDFVKLGVFRDTSTPRMVQCFVSRRCATHFGPARLALDSFCRAVQMPDLAKSESLRMASRACQRIRLCADGLAPRNSPIRPSAIDSGHSGLSPRRPAGWAVKGSFSRAWNTHSHACATCIRTSRCVLYICTQHIYTFTFICIYHDYMSSVSMRSI